MKNVIIFGDSYSTFEGYIPNGYATYYSNNGRPQGPDVTKMTVEQTWWHQFFKKTGANLILNDSWSGSPIGYIAYNGEDCSKTSSFIHRLRLYKSLKYFDDKDIDTVFVFGGTNDSCSDAPLGEIKLSNWEESDLYTVLGAIPYFMSELRCVLPNARIYFIVNYGLKQEIDECIIKGSSLFNYKVIELENFSRDSGHPTIKGMQEICNQIIDKIE